MSPIKALPRILILILFLSACSPQKKLARLIKKHPELITIDTGFKIDTTILERIKFDTSFVNKHTRDTVIIENERLKIEVINTGDSIRVSGESKQDTIYKRIPQYFHKVVVIPDKRYSLSNLLGFGLMALVIFLLILKLILWLKSD